MWIRKEGVMWTPFFLTQKMGLSHKWVNWKLIKHDEWVQTRKKKDLTSLQMNPPFCQAFWPLWLWNLFFGLHTHLKLRQNAECRSKNKFDTIDNILQYLLVYITSFSPLDRFRCIFCCSLWKYSRETLSFLLHVLAHLKIQHTSGIFKSTY